MSFEANPGGFDEVLIEPSRVNLPKTGEVIDNDGNTVYTFSGNGVHSFHRLKDNAYLCDMHYAVSLWVAKNTLTASIDSDVSVRPHSYANNVYGYAKGGLVGSPIRYAPAIYLAFHDSGGGLLPGVDIDHVHKHMADWLTFDLVRRREIDVRRNLRISKKINTDIKLETATNVSVFYPTDNKIGVNGNG